MVPFKILPSNCFATCWGKYADIFHHSTFQQAWLLFIKINFRRLLHTFTMKCLVWPFGGVETQTLWYTVVPLVKLHRHKLPHASLKLQEKVNTHFLKSIFFFLAWLIFFGSWVIFLKKSFQYLFTWVLPPHHHITCYKPICATHSNSTFSFVNWNANTRSDNIAVLSNDVITSSHISCFLQFLCYFPLFPYPTVPHFSITYILRKKKKTNGWIVSTDVHNS